MGLEYRNYSIGYGNGLLISGRTPVDIRSVVSTENDLYNNSSTWDLNKPYPGLLVSVLDSKEVYLFINNSGDYNPADHDNWKKISTPDLDISGEMVDVVLAIDGKYYNQNDCTEDPVGTWTPKSGAQEIVNSEVTKGGPGKYLHLTLENDDTDIYIKSTDLIDLSDYYTKNEINSSFYNKTEINDFLSIRDTSIITINTSVNNIESFINSSIGDTIFNNSSTIQQYIDAKDSSIYNDISILYNDVSILNYNVSTLINDLGEGIVHSIVSNASFISADPSMNHVTINASILKAIDDSIFPSTGLITDGYFNEKMSWVEVEDMVSVEDPGE